jgi:hypothetical protein
MKKRHSDASWGDNSKMDYSFKKYALAAIMLSTAITSPALSADGFAGSNPAIHNGVDEFSSQDRDHGHGGGKPGPGRPGPGRPGVGRPGPGGRPGMGMNRGPGFRGGGRPFRGWARRPYYGTILGGIALGTIVGVAIAGTAPVAPAPNMCWFWNDQSYTQGYWDYCVAP